LLADGLITADVTACPSGPAPIEGPDNSGPALCVSATHAPPTPTKESK
jgi:hypothetical protein